MTSGELGDVALGDLVEGEAGGGGQRGEIPEHVTDLLGDPGAIERAFVEESLLDQLLDLAALAAEADGGHRQGLAERQVRAHRVRGLRLVDDEVHQSAPLS